MFSLVILNIQYLYGQMISSRYVWLLTLMCLVVFSQWSDQILFWMASVRGWQGRTSWEWYNWVWLWDVAFLFVLWFEECSSSPEVISILFHLWKRYLLHDIESTLLWGILIFCRVWMCSCPDRIWMREFVLTPINCSFAKWTLTKCNSAKSWNRGS